MKVLEKTPYLSFRYCWVQNWFTAFHSNCSALVTVGVQDYVSIDEIRVNPIAASNHSAKSGNPNRVSLLFGEHSRELIGPETGLMLLPLSAHKSQQVSTSFNKFQHSLIFLDLPCFFLLLVSKHVSVFPRFLASSLTRLHLHFYDFLWSLFHFHPFSFSFCSLALRSRYDLRKMLCGETSTKKGMLEEALKDSEFQLILNANPSSRLRVEAGPKSSKMDQNGSTCEPNTKKGWEGAKELEGLWFLTFFDISWMFWTCLDMLGPALFLVSFLLEEQLWISWSQLNPDPWLCHFHCAAVAAGEYCLRENPNGVDLNRNWDEKWDLGTEHSAEQSHGKRPFSEPLDSMLSNFLTQSDSKQGRYGEIWGDTRKQVPWKVYEVISYIWIYMKLYMHIILIC